MRTSAEYRAITTQVYRAALARVTELARERAAGSWAVILDADETVLDNSEYQRRRAAIDSGYTEPSWSAWVRERAAAAVPGALEFIRGVQTQGGRIAIVTNRADSLCAVTRENLGALRMNADLVLCQTPGESDKNPRFRRVQDGTAASGMRPLFVVAWVGDNIQDFPGLRQTARDDSAALRMFGDRYFILPNPMYGSWERVPERPVTDTGAVLDAIAAWLWREEIADAMVRSVACGRGSTSACASAPTPVWHDEPGRSLTRSLAARIGIAVGPRRPDQPVPPCPWPRAPAGAGYEVELAIGSLTGTAVSMSLGFRCDNPPGYLHDSYRNAYEFELERRGSAWVVTDVRKTVT